MEIILKETKLILPTFGVLSIDQLYYLYDNKSRQVHIKELVLFDS